MVHIAGMALWLWVASPLWRISDGERCPDFGDSLYLVMWVLPSLAIGLLAAVGAVIYRWIKRDLPERRHRRTLWSYVLGAWLVIALIAYVMITRDAALGCHP
jgi:hypothetical protein